MNRRSSPVRATLITMLILCALVGLPGLAGCSQQTGDGDWAQTAPVLQPQVVRADVRTTDMIALGAGSVRPRGFQTVD